MYVLLKPIVFLTSCSQKEKGKRKRVEPASKRCVSGAGGVAQKAGLIIPFKKKKINKRSSLLIPDMFQSVSAELWECLNWLERFCFFSFPGPLFVFAPRKC